MSHLLEIFYSTHCISCPDARESARPPNTLAYSGNAIVYPAGNGRAFVPYATGGVGGLTMFERQALGVSEAATFPTGNVGGGAKYYFNSQWGLCGDYRFLAVRSRDVEDTMCQATSGAQKLGEVRSTR